MCPGLTRIFLNFYFSRFLAKHVSQDSQPLDCSFLFFFPQPIYFSRVLQTLPIQPHLSLESHEALGIQANNSLESHGPLAIQPNIPPGPWLWAKYSSGSCRPLAIQPFLKGLADPWLFSQLFFLDLVDPWSLHHIFSRVPQNPCPFYQKYFSWVSQSLNSELRNLPWDSQLTAWM